jgi:hypothetical protein
LAVDGAALLSFWGIVLDEDALFVYFLALFLDLFDIFSTFFDCGFSRFVNFLYTFPSPFLKTL